MAFYHGGNEPLGKITKRRCKGATARQFADLLPVVGRVGQHGGHMEHQLIVLVGGVERVCARGVRCKHKRGYTAGQSRPRECSRKKTVKKRERKPHCVIPGDDVIGWKIKDRRA